MTHHIPQLFVGSTVEKKEYINHLQNRLKNTVIMKRWDREVFNRALGNYLEDLVKAIETSNCALFIFSADDQRIKKGLTSFVPRDNLIFEAGIAIGLLGRDRVFIVKDYAATLPSDLEGLSVFSYKGDDFETFKKSVKFDDLLEKLRNLHKIKHGLSIVLKDDVSKDVKNGVENE
jgi:predicted nucleotide-binding protein